MKEYKLSMLGKIITGYTPSTNNNSNYLTKDYMFISPSDLKKQRLILNTDKYISEYAMNHSKNRELYPGDVVVDCIGSDMGNVGIVTNKCISNQQINAISMIDETIINYLYLYYLLTTKKEYFHQIGMNGSTMPIISKSLFADIIVNVHDLKLQQHIVDIVRSYTLC